MFDDCFSVECLMYACNDCWQAIHRFLGDTEATGVMGGRGLMRGLQLHAITAETDGKHALLGQGVVSLYWPDRRVFATHRST
jgi:hypothetical protein